MLLTIFLISAGGKIIETPRAANFYELTMRACIENHWYRNFILASHDVVIHGAMHGIEYQGGCRPVAGHQHIQSCKNLCRPDVDLLESLLRLRRSLAHVQPEIRLSICLAQVQ